MGTVVGTSSAGQTNRLVTGVAPGLPKWVSERLELAEEGIQLTDCGEKHDQLTLVSGADGSFAMTGLVIPRAVALNAGQLEEAVCDAYTRVQRRLADSSAPYPVRFWNFIPSIHEQLGPVSRYMAFNAGRFAALALSRAEGPGIAGETVSFPTASGVGYAGTDLVIYGLGAAHPGTPVENPRQIPAYRYSTRFGPRPPCFTRATSIRVGSGAALLVAGTASVVGEDSRHAGNLRHQLAETFDNLDALIAAWRGQLAKEGIDDCTALPDNLRAYYVREGDRDAVTAAVRVRYPHIDSVETVRADICRPELLVEVECTVALDSRSPRADVRRGRRT